MNMDFKFSGNVFKNTTEDHQRLYGDKYEPGKNYPEFTGVVEVPLSQITDFCEYVVWAQQSDELKVNDYLKEKVVPIKVSGWAKDAKSGKKFLSLSYSPDYKTKNQAAEAKDAHEIQQHQKKLDAEPQAVQKSAESLAKATDGDVIF